MRRPLQSRMLGIADREAALGYLARDRVANLFLLDLTARLGSPPQPGEAPTEIVGTWRDGGLVGVSGLRPNVILDASAGGEIVDALVPYLEGLSVGLVKSFAPAVDELWSQLERRRGRRAIIDRIETAYALRERDARLVEAGRDERCRRAAKADLADLVVAARESLREESRPDPFSGDVKGFRRWVRGRVSRARVVESSGRVTMVGYADVQRREGWLLQGIYTWPDCRRRGLGALGVSGLCREAFDAGADHVQLAVVDGNDPARRLYEGMGFRPFAKLRTILFT
jgi:ribosomal protein S18 acetylase RimI-like enzyme